MVEQKPIDEIIAIIAQMRSRINKRVNDSIEKIISFCYEYGQQSKTFTFDKDAKLEDEINRLLIELSDAIYFDFEYYAEEVLANKEDKDKVFGLIFGDIDGQNTLYRIDQHSSDLKTLIEAALAIGFANSLTKERLILELTQNLKNIRLWDKLKKAYNDNFYEAELIQNKGTFFGKGNNTNIIDAIALVGTQSIIGSYNYSFQLDAERDGAKYWTTIRGSSYDCGLCDSMVGIKHPITEPFVGFHPRCMCIMIPIYE